MTTPKASFTSEIRSLSRPVWILSVGTLIDRFGFFVYPFLVLFLTNEGMKKELAGVAAGLLGLGGLCAAIAGGYLTDRVGRRKTITISMFGGAVLTLLLYTSVVQAPNIGGYWATFLTTFLYGLVRGMYHSASSSLLGDLTPPNRLVAAFTVLRFAINLGFALGMAAAALMFHLEASFVWLFGLDAVTSVIFGFIAVTSLPQGLRTKKEDSGWGKALAVMGASPAFLFLCVNSFVIALIINQWGSSFAYHLKHDLGYEEKTYGLLMLVNGVLIVCFEIPISAFVRRFSPPKVIAFGSVVAAVGFGLLAVVEATSGWGSDAFGISVKVFIISGWTVAMTVFTIGEMVTFPMQGAYIAMLAPSDMRGRYNGANGLMWSFSAIIGPIVGLSLLNFGTSALCAVMVALGIGERGFARQESGRVTEVSRFCTIACEW